MPSLEELQKAIAIQITSLSPEAQTVTLQVVALCYKAGYQAAQEDMKLAARSLSPLIH